MSLTRTVSPPPSCNFFQPAPLIEDYFSFVECKQAAEQKLNAAASEASIVRRQMAQADLILRYSYGLGIVEDKVKADELYSQYIKEWRLEVERKFSNACYELDSKNRLSRMSSPLTTRDELNCLLEKAIQYVRETFPAGDKFMFPLLRGMRAGEIDHEGGRLAKEYEELDKERKQSPLSTGSIQPSKANELKLMEHKDSFNNYVESSTYSAMIAAQKTWVGCCWYNSGAALLYLYQHLNENFFTSITFYSSNNSDNTHAFLLLNVPKLEDNKSMPQIIKNALASKADRERIIIFDPSMADYYSLDEVANIVVFHPENKGHITVTIPGKDTKSLEFNLLSEPRSGKQLSYYTLAPFHKNAERRLVKQVMRAFNLYFLVNSPYPNTVRYDKDHKLGDTLLNITNQIKENGTKIRQYQDSTTKHFAFKLKLAL